MMQDLLAPKETATLLPPRPNPGPEPWSEAIAWPVVGTSIALILLVLFAAFRLSRWPKRGPDRSANPADTLRATAIGESNGQRCSLEPSMAVRRTLAEALGPSWLARTTEEIAADPWLSDHLNGTLLQPLIDVLGAADRVKFQSRQHVEWSDPRLADLLAKLKLALSKHGTAEPGSMRADRFSEPIAVGTGGG